MNIILLGAPASGKGTQATFLAKKFDLYLLQTGELSRKLAQTDPDIKKMYDAGKLIPHELVTMHVINFLSTEKPDLKNILFEGFPRFIPQYKALETFLKEKGDDIDLIVSIDISIAESVKRISSRRICSVCGKIYNLVTMPPTSGKCDCGGELIQRSDDNPQSVKVRFKYYEDNTKELIDYLNRKGLLVSVNGERSVEEIQEDLVRLVSEVKNEKDRS